jgi:WD40 repeat protein
LYCKRLLNECKSIILCEESCNLSPAGVCGYLAVNRKLFLQITFSETTFSFFLCEQHLGFTWFPERDIYHHISYRIPFNIRGGYMDFGSKNLSGNDCSVFSCMKVEWSTRQIMSGHCSYIHCVALSASGRIAISGSQDEPVFVWDMMSGQCIGHLDGHIGRVTAAALSANGKIAITAGWDQTLRCWDVENQSCFSNIAASHDLIETAALSADGKTAVTGDQGGNVGIWDVRSGRRLHLFQQHREPVFAVAMSANGDIVVSGGADSDVMIWDTGSGCRVKTISRSFTGCIRSLDLSVAGNVLLAGLDDHNVYAWDVNSGRLLKKMEGHSGAVLSVGVSDDDRTGVSGSEDGTVRVWNIEDGVCVNVLDGHSEPPVYVAMSSDGRTAVSGSRDQTVIVWSIDLNDNAGSIAADAQFRRERRYEAGVYSNDGSVTVSGKLSNHFIVKRDDIPGGKVTVEVGEEIKLLNVSADGRIAVTAPWGNFLQLWETETGKCLGKLEGNGGNITAVSLSADGKMGVTADVHGVIRLWDIYSRNCLKIFPCRALAVALSLDGRFALTGGRDKTIRAWYTGTGNCLFKLEGHTGTVNSLALSPKGDLAVSGASDKTLRIWDLNKECCIAVKEHHCEVTDVSIVGGRIRLIDSCGDVVDWAMENIKFPSLSLAEIGTIKVDNSNTDNQNIFRYDIAALEAEAEAKNKRFHPKCSICGNRLNMNEAKSKGLTSKGVWDCLGYDYCYFFAKPVEAVNFKTRRPRECSHFVSFEVLRFDVDLQ